MNQLFLRCLAVSTFALVASFSGAFAQTPTLTWDASQNLDGDDQWPAMQDAGRTWVFSEPAIARFGPTEFPGAPAWFNSPAATMASLDGVGGSNANVSWELVFRPGDLNGIHVLFETGGNGDGTGFVLQGATLEFRVQDAATAEQRVVATHTLTAGDGAKFHHVVATVTLGLAGASEVNLFVNAGAPVATLGATGDLNDWAGGDAAGLGVINGGITIGLAGVEPFTGDIALLNYYEGAVLTQAEVQAKFEALAAGDGSFDSEPDGLPDLWEMNFFNNLDALPETDEEPDDLTNLEELNNGTDPTKADTDGDGINDGAELSSDPPTIPTNPDTDGDGLTDGEEGPLNTDPTDPDSDGDGVDDGIEVENGFDPNDPNDPPSGTGAKIIWVTENTDAPSDPSPDDLGWTNLLRLNGFDVERRDIRALDTDQAALDEMNAADLVIFSRDSNSGNYNTSAEEVTAWNSGITVPLIQMSSFLVRNNRWFWFDNAANPVAGGDNIAVSDPGHPIFSGISLDENNEFAILASEQVNVTGGVGAGNGTVLATDPTNGNVWVAHWEAGVEFYAGAGHTPVAPRLWFGAGVVDNDPKGGENFTADGEKAFVNAVNFMLGAGEPELRFTQITYDAIDDRFSLEWISKPNASYSLCYSEDLALDFNYDDGIPSMGETTSIELDNPVEGATRLYFRVIENPSSP